jgi:predicted RNase H-like HicB family nuclease
VNVIEVIPFSDAKARLSDVMTAVVHGHRPKAVGRHRGKEEMFLVGRDELLAVLESFAFEPKVAVSEGEFVVRLPELGLIAAGESLDEALDELVELAEAYTEDFLDRLEFFRQTDRRGQLPWVVRVAATPPEARRALFTQVPQAAPDLQPA